MNLFSLIRNLVDGSKVLDISSLPTRGYFYPEDFVVKIKKANDEDIIEYEYKYDSQNIMEIVECVKRIVQKNTIFNKDYDFNYLKSVDIIFIFLEIVIFTTKKTIKIEFFNDESRKPDTIDFSSKNFKYYNFDSVKEFYDVNDRSYLINGYRFSMPSVGIENCLAQFLLTKSNNDNAELYSNFSYDFLFFLGFKSHLSFDEIDNLITIFNYDLDDQEKEKIKSIIDMFLGMIGYQLKFRNHLIDVKSNLNLEKIWKI
jgi:hypothetical protein